MRWDAPSLLDDLARLERRLERRVERRRPGREERGPAGGRLELRQSLDPSECETSGLLGRRRGRGRQSAGERRGDEELEKVPEEVDETEQPTHEISPSMRVLAAPTLSCATAYVLSTSARRPGPTSTAPEAAARERACGSVFWYDEGFCGGCEGRVSEVRGEGEEREGGEGARRAPRAAGGWCLAERQQFQSAVVQTMQDDNQTAQRALDAPLVAAAAHELRLCAMLPPISVADSVRLTG